MFIVQACLGVIGYIFSMKRVIILGSCGAGKSVFAKKLAGFTSLPLHHLDKLYWKPYWEESDIDDFTKRLLVLINDKEWIIDGNYSRTITLRAARADTIIFLDYPRWLCIVRVLKRWL